MRFSATAAPLHSADDCSDWYPFVSQVPDATASINVGNIPEGHVLGPHGTQQVTLAGPLHLPLMIDDMEPQSAVRLHMALSFSAAHAPPPVVGEKPEVEGQHRMLVPPAHLPLRVAVPHV